MVCPSCGNEVVSEVVLEEKGQLTLEALHSLHPEVSEEEERLVILDPDGD